MQLVDRYLQAVKRLLPKAQQEDILKELQANILSEMDEREAELGRPLTDDEQSAILSRQGSPTLVASRYRQDQRTFTFGHVIIGPMVFPLYVRILALNVCITLCLVPFIRMFVGDQVDFATLLFPLVLQFVVITAVFAGIEQAQKKYQVLDRWNPRDLPPARDKFKISRTSTLFEMFFNALFVLCLLRIPGAAHAVAYMFVGPLASFLAPSNQHSWLFAPSWQVFYLPILLLVLVGIAQQGLNFAFPRWTRNRLIIRVGLSLLAVLVNIGLFRAGNMLLVNPEVPNAAQYAGLFFVINQSIHYCILFGFFFSAGDIAVQIRRIFQLTPAPSQSHSATTAVC
jgi:uncharacterized metal-binding protein